MGVAMSWLKGTAAVVAGLAVFVNLPTRLWMSAERASLEYLASTQLSTITEDEDNRKKFQASDLWKDRGAVIMSVRRPG